MVQIFRGYSSGIEHLTVDQEVPGSRTGTKVVNKGTNVDQCNRIESPEINSYSYVQLTYDKGGKTIQWRKDRFSINGFGKSG